MRQRQRERENDYEKISQRARIYLQSSSIEDIAWSPCVIPISSELLIEERTTKIQT